jgi:ABC-type bacteriocin/lantibiotic exporter with double-glycine peptidase domain
MASRHRFLAPEVVQSSALDCGPAALKCLLEGFGLSVHYGRLREACQTGIDGTSIDAIERVAHQLGLEAEQIMLPTDHLLLAESKALPAIVVVKLPSGLTHFVVLWRRYGSLLQVMDPATGRRWVHAAEFLRDIYLHTISVAAADWRDFASSDSFQMPLRARMRALGISEQETTKIMSRALADAQWHGLATLDAAVRLAAFLSGAGSLGKGTECLRVIQQAFEKPEGIPASFWSVRSGSKSDEGDPILMTGAVLIRVRGVRPKTEALALTSDLAATITEPTESPVRAWFVSVRCKWPIVLGLVLAAGVVAAGSLVLDALLFFGLVGFGAHALNLTGAVLFLSGALLLVELCSLMAAFHVGRHIELGYRRAFLKKLSRLADRYFHSRLTSDMAERHHMVHRLRSLALLTYQLLCTSFEILATMIAIVWLEPWSGRRMAVILAACLLPLLLVQPVLTERDLRLRTHTGGLMRFYLDAMLGLTAVRAHHAQESVRHEHGQLLCKWVRAAQGLLSAVAMTEAVQLIAAFLLIASWIAVQNPGVRLLLCAYWVLKLPTLAQDFGLVARQYPALRNLTLRLLEPLGAPEEKPVAANTKAKIPALISAPAITFRGVSVEISGHKVLDGLDFSIEPGSHVAVIGHSGSGKSSLVGVLLGWFRPSEGEVLVDGQPLDCEQLRLHTAWIDPAVQLWNRSLLENVVYGSSKSGRSRVRHALDTALIKHLCKGLGTPLGEGGGLLSGGEAQRVRFARALTRNPVRLVILDEPFRGLDRGRRRQLLRRARHVWSGCTLFCITHDIAETQDFDRVLVLEQGRLVEQGHPLELRSQCRSRYAQLLESEIGIRNLWLENFWRRIRIRSGRLSENAREAVTESELELT